MERSELLMITPSIFSCIFALKADYGYNKKAELKVVHCLLKYNTE